MHLLQCMINCLFISHSEVHLHQQIARPDIRLSLMSMEKGIAYNQDLILGFWIKF